MVEALGCQRMRRRQHVRKYREYRILVHCDIEVLCANLPLPRPISCSSSSPLARFPRTRSSSPRSSARLLTYQ